MSLKSGHSVVPLTDKEQEEQNEQFKAFKCGLVRLQPDGWFFSKPFIDVADKVYDFKFKPTDIVIMSYPKSGTTWTQEVVWTMMKNPNLDNPDASLPVYERSPYLEGDFILKHQSMPLLAPGFKMYDTFVEKYPDRNPEEGILLSLTELAPDPRIIKTHLSFPLLPPNMLETCKIIYVARKPNDVIVSSHHHSMLIKYLDFVGTFDQFLDHFLKDNLLYSPYWTHIKEAWSRRNHKNMHFVFYEDMKADPRAEILRLEEYLGVSLTDKQVKQIVDYTDFHEMQKRDVKTLTDINALRAFFNKNVMHEQGGFFKKDETGEWVNALTEENEQKISEWIKKNAEKFDPNYKYAKDI